VQGIALFPLENEEAGPPASHPIDEDLSLGTPAPLKNASLRMTPLGILVKKQNSRGGGCLARLFCCVAGEPYCETGCCGVFGAFK
jgi:hypothetical protein